MKKALVSLFAVGLLSFGLMSFNVDPDPIECTKCPGDCCAIIFQDPEGGEVVVVTCCSNIDMGEEGGE